MPEIPDYVIEHLATPEGMARMLDAMDHRVFASIWVFPSPAVASVSTSPASVFDVTLSFPSAMDRADDSGMVEFRMPRSEVRMFSQMLDNLAPVNPEIVVHIHSRRQSDALPQQIAMSPRFTVESISPEGTSFACEFPTTNRIVLTRDSSMPSAGAGVDGRRRGGIIGFSWKTDTNTLMQCLYS